jgi:hypothetical protein
MQTPPLCRKKHSEYIRVVKQCDYSSVEATKILRFHALKKCHAYDGSLLDSKPRTSVGCF